MNAEPSMPENIEAEAMLLGALLIENSLIAKLAGKIGEDDFYEPVHARVFASIKRWSNKGKQVNARLLRPEFEADEGLAVLGGTTYLFRLTADNSGLPHTSWPSRSATLPTAAALSPRWKTPRAPIAIRRKMHRCPIWRRCWNCPNNRAQHSTC